MNRGMKNMKNVEFLFLQIEGKNINLLKTGMDWHEQALCCDAHIYLSHRTSLVQSIS